MENKTLRLRLCWQADAVLKQLKERYPELNPNQILNKLLLDAALDSKENQDDDYTTQ
jgi:hypothetical protein